MRIHIHNDPGSIDAPISATEWAAAGIHGHEVSFGTTAAQFLAAAARMEALIAPPWAMHTLDLAAAPRLKLVQSTSAGVDALHPFHMIPPGVLLMNNRGTHAAKAGEYALMAILMLVNLLPRFVADQRAGRWQRQTAGLARARRLTIVGLGSLGGAAAAQARHLGMDVIGIRNGATPHPQCDRTLTLEQLDAVLPGTDILLLACPLTPATRRLLSAARIAALPPGAGVINIGRGKLIDQAALFAALQEEHLSGAVLDVFEAEPIPPGDPAWSVKNLIVTPHMSSDDLTTYNANTLDIFGRNLQAFEAGAPPPTLVDRAKGY